MFPRQRHSPHPAVLVSIVTIALMTIAILFPWPATEIHPRDLPVGFVGPEQVAQSITPNLEANGLDVKIYDSQERAEKAIRERDVYGAIVIGEGSAQVLTASAASPVVAQLLIEVSSNLPVPATVTDLVPTGKGDPRGIALGVSVLPMILGGLLIGASISLTIQGGISRFTWFVTAAIAAGLAVNLLLQTWLEILDGNWLANAAVLAFVLLSIALIVGAGITLFGPAGTGVGAVLVMLIGNPFSGAPTSPDLLPDWVSITGQLLPPGAGITLLRNTAFFDGNATLIPLFVLTAWIAVAGSIVVLQASGTPRGVPALQPERNPS